MIRTAALETMAEMMGVLARWLFLFYFSFSFFFWIGFGCGCVERVERNR